MLKRHPKTYRKLLALIALGGAAIFTVYYLYFRPPVPYASREIVARQIQVDSSTTISSKVTYRFTEEEKKAVLNPSSVQQPPGADSSDPGFTIVAANEEIQPSSSPTIKMPSPLDSPHPANVSELSPNAARRPSVPEQGFSGSPELNAESFVERISPNQEISNEKIPRIDDAGMPQAITRVLTAEDEKAEKLADLSLDGDQGRKAPADQEQNPGAALDGIQPSAKPVKKEVPDTSPTAAVVSSQPATGPKPLEKTNGFKPQTAKPKSLKDTVWVINVISTQNEKRQWDVFKILSQYPYRVYTYTTEVKGKEWKRIRIGFFATKEEALAAGQKISRKHKLPQPWIVQPGREEMEKFYLE